MPPSGISRTKPLIRLVLNQIGRRLTGDLHAKNSRHRVLLMVDEFPALGGGPWGRLLDAETERLGEAEVQAFETEGLIGADAAPAVLSYLFTASRTGSTADPRF